MRKKKLSRTVTKKKGLYDIVQGAARVQGPMIVKSLTEKLAPAFREDQSPPDLGSTIEVHTSWLSHVCNDMVQADEAHMALLDQMAQLRTAESAQSAGLRSLILRIRSAYKGLVGESSLAPLALDFKVDQSAAGILRQSEIIRDRLLQAEVGDLVSVSWAPGPLDPQLLAAELDRHIQPLAETLRTIIDVRKQTDTAVVAKHQSIKTFDKEFVPAVQVLEATFRVAGHVELADRIRPTVRQLSRTNVPDDEEGEPEEGSSDESSAPAEDGEPSSIASEEAVDDSQS